MASDKIIYYDSEFIKKFEELKTLLEDEDRPKIYQFLLKEFQFIFLMKVFSCNYFDKFSSKSPPFLLCS